MAGIEDYYRNGMRVPPGPSVKIMLGPKAMPSPLDQYFANLRKAEAPPLPAIAPVPTTSPAQPVEPAVVSDEDDRGPGMWTQRDNPSLTLPSWIKNPSELF
ncbi:MAG: hypothetical protein E6Q97_25700 [Desulfurellales bacterium]|nr:MAG: hypothetical protein E6Q97_25700 [Desulfurellales bacterium]